MYRFSYENNGGRDKVDCPFCGGVNRYTRVFDRETGEFLPAEQYGICDRINNCERGTGVMPKQMSLKGEEKEYENKDEYRMSEGSVMPDTEAWFSEKMLSENTLIVNLVKIFGEERVYDAAKRLKVGSFLDRGTVFHYYFEGELRTGKVMWYEGLHRRKDKHPLWLHSMRYKQDNGREFVGNQTEDFVKRYPLFGWDAIPPESQDKVHKVCVVESEKSALICSIVIPEVSWVATGALSWLQSYRIPYHNDKLWYWLPDMGIINSDTGFNNEDYWRKLVANRYPTMIHGFPQWIPELTPEEQRIGEEAGFDVADFIIAGGDEYVKFLRKTLKV